MKYLAIDIGGTFTKYAVMDEDGIILAKNKIPTAKENPTQFLDMIVKLYRIYEKEVSGIAISAAGVIDSEKGYMYNGGSIFCIKNLAVVTMLREKCHVPITIENDARCAALAELWRGSLKGCKQAALFILGTAVGGAVICDGKVVSGYNLLAGEFSYILTDANDSSNPKNILANAGGVPALIQMVSKTKEILIEDLNGQKIFDMAVAGDQEIMQCIRTYAHQLAVQINNCQFIMNPEKVAIGGGISEQPLLLEMIREELKKLNTLYSYKMPVPTIVSCKYFNDSNLIGALYVHLKNKNR